MLKEIKFFEKDTLSLRNKFYVLLNLLIKNQSTTRLEIVLLSLATYIQLIAGFFSLEIQVLNPSTSQSDRILYLIHKVIRVKDLFIDKHNEYQIAVYFLFALILIFFSYFSIVLVQVKNNSFYSFKYLVLNYCLKIFLYVTFTLTIDLAVMNVCFDSKHQYFNGMNCNVSTYLPVFIISFISLVLSLIFNIFIQLYYNESFYLSSSFYSKIDCNYSLLFTLNQVVSSVMLIQAQYLLREVYLIYSIIVSFLFLMYIYEKYVFYDKITNIIAGIFHIEYLWTSLFFTVFAYLDYSEKGLIYILTSLVVVVLYFCIRYRVEQNIIFKTPYYRIKSKYYLLFYLKFLIDTINVIDHQPREKALLTGILKMHKKECPNDLCLSKTTKKIYLPLIDQWSDRTKEAIDDKIYLSNFVIVIMNFFVAQNYVSPEMILNEAMYFLQHLGNYCQAILYYKKARDMKMTIQERFSLIRLELAISKTLMEKLQPSNEICTNFPDLNFSLYFKYEDLRENFINELNNDLSLSLDFWKAYQNGITENVAHLIIDFNEIFNTVDLIRISKDKIEQLWNELFSLYPGLNDLFELYSQYVETINDDDLLKRDLEAIRRKNESPSENITLNFYNVIFSIDTGIIVVNGDNDKEGLIEKTNYEIESIFQYTAEELKGMNIDKLMPNLFARQHKDFMKRYIAIGEKRVIDKKEIYAPGKDKNASLVYFKSGSKLFPVLNPSIFFVAWIKKENVDDMILLDNKFIIHGMSLKLYQRLKVNSKLFNDNEIPFYVICRKFLDFYKLFFRGKKKKELRSGIKNNAIRASMFDNSQESLITKLEDIKELNNNENANANAIVNNNNNQADDIENIEITENIELEYELSIPQFIMDYMKISKDTDVGRITSIETTRLPTNNIIIGNIDETHNDMVVITEEKEPSDDMENEQLIPKDDNKDHHITPGNNGDYSSNRNTIPQSENRMQKPQEIDNEKRVFKDTIAKQRQLFETKQFDELNALMKKCAKNTKDPNEFKFNFTLDKYIYGEKQIAYIIRCIDNKNEGGDSDEETKIFNDNDPLMLRIKKDKMDFSKKIIQIDTNENNQLITRHEKFIDMTNQNKNFQKLLKSKLEEIGQYSRVHGIKKEEIITEDENSSQTSQTSYKNDLCKKNRIDEIRRNVMNNVSNFWVLKYISVLQVIVILLTIAFMSVYLVLNQKLHDSLIESVAINSDLYLTTIWMNNIVSALISMRTLFYLRVNKESYAFRLFISGGEIEYFNYFKNNSLIWHQKLLDRFSILEARMRDYVEPDDSLFWGYKNITYPHPDINDQESFPLAMGQIMSTTGFLLIDPYFIIKQDGKYNYPDMMFEVHNYLTFMSIENAIMNIIPLQIELINYLPGIFMKANSNKLFNMILLLALYNFLVIITSAMYMIMISIINRSLGEGLHKVTKIKLEKIEEIIKKIDTFQKSIPFYREKNVQESIESRKDGKLNPKVPNVPNLNLPSIPNATSNNSSSQGFSSEPKNVKELSVLIGAYVQTLILFICSCATLIPLALVTWSMINSTNEILNTESYLLGSLFNSAASTVYIKCLLAECKTTAPLNYTRTQDATMLKNIILQMDKYPKLNAFYRNEYLMNACLAAFASKDNENYTSCLKDIIIQYSNNTDSLINLMTEHVADLARDKELKKGKDILLSNGTTVVFTPVLLFNSSTFSNLEQTYFLYLVPVSDRIAIILTETIDEYLHSSYTLSLLLVIAFGMMVLIVMIYVAVFYIKKMIYYLLISRCILRIIPTIVINNTQELGTWIEAKY